MKVLVIGSGAREHALCLALAKDPTVSELNCAPGNPGIAQVARTHPLDLQDAAATASLATELRADLVVIGPEAPLVAGVSDALRSAGISCFGPSASAAQLEASKSFAKEVMAAADVPTAEARLCTDAAEVTEALEKFGPPYVVKADGLAAGKGVVVTDDHAVALSHAMRCERVLVEEYLDGPEVSLFAVTDGSCVVPLIAAQDFKRIGDGDTGPNTGGMGAYAPLPWVPSDLAEQVTKTVLQPTVDEMARRETPFVGLLYAGLALTSNGLRVVEFNARFGDPETQVVLALLETPLAGLLHAAATGTLADHPPLRWRAGAAVTVVVAAGGYPSQPRAGDPISGIDQVPPPAYVLHAGTARRGDELVSAGGRVLSVTATGASLAEARDAAYAGVAAIRLPGSQHRTDIALRAVRGEVSPP